MAKTEATTLARAFPNPYELSPPPEAEGWERMYPAYYRFDGTRRNYEVDKFWFFDGLHYPEPMYPFDTIMPESTWAILNQFTTKYFVVPGALGLDHRILNGYIFVGPTTVTDPEEIKRRAELFDDRAGYYFQNWDRLYEEWVSRTENLVQRLREIKFESLPEVIPTEAVHSSRNVSEAHRLLESYDRLIENFHEMQYQHFDMVGLGYGAYYVLISFCREAFPGITDQTITKMVVGIEILMTRPDDELRKLAKLAVELGIGDAFDGGDPDDILARLRERDGGDRWLAAFEEAREPWFWFSTGTGLTHQYPAWNDDLSFPFSILTGYIHKSNAGENIDRDVDTIVVERERITAEYREFLDDAGKAKFDELIALARMVFPLVENHNFYTEHYHHSTFWNKVRELGAVVAHHGFLNDAEDIFLFHRWEIHQLLWDLVGGWALGGPPDRSDYWKNEARERERMLEALRHWKPPVALGPVPERFADPLVDMLWGVTDETVNEWLKVESGEVGAAKELRGIPASAGVVQGPARVILSLGELGDVQEGDVLVCPVTAPSWAPVFPKIKAAVCDVGGLMAHAAIVAREYGLPAVVGTGIGTKTIETGQTVEVDGTNGIVRVLD
jgi:pyruvate,water dikinase